MLNRDMTLKEYRDYFADREAHHVHHLMCHEYYESLSTQKDGKTSVFCFAMAVLLGGVYSNQHTKIFLEDIYVIGSKGNYKTSTWSQNVSQVFGNKSDSSIATTINRLIDGLSENLTIDRAFEKMRSQIIGLQGEKDSKFTKEYPDKLIGECLKKILVSPTEEYVIEQIRLGGCRQIIFTGAPGTGKTYSAKNIAATACSGSNAWGAELPVSKTETKPYTMVQFHPSYDYTDFVEGLRPIPAVDSPAEKIEITSRCDYQNLMNGLRDTMSQNAPAQPVLVENRFDCTALLSGLQSVMNAGQVRFAKVDGTFKAFCRKVAAKNEQFYQRHVEKTRGSIAAYAAGLEKANVSTETIKTAYAFISGLPQYLYEEGTDNARSLIKQVEAPLCTRLLKNTCGTLKADLSAQQTACEKDTSAQTLPLLEKWIAEAEEWTALLTKDQANAGKELLTQLNTVKMNLIFKQLLTLLEKDDRTKAKQVLTEHEDFLEEMQKPRFLKNLKKAVEGDAAQTKTLLQNAVVSLAAVISAADGMIAELDTAISTEPLADAVQALRTLAQELDQNADALLDPEKAEHPLYFFIIDEINRANLSKVFGELMYCLEKDKRGKQNAIQTQYQKLPTYDLEAHKLLPEAEDCFWNGFYIPENVVVIGTMNDIDRSVDSMDFALRRRFEWKEFVVDAALLTNAFKFGSYGDSIAKAADTLAACIVKLNNYLLEKGKHYGLNRQYFISQGQFSNLPANLKNEKDILKYVWEYRIESLLREYLRGEDEEKIEEFVGSYDEMTGACKALFSALPDDTGDKDENDDDSDETSGTTPPDGTGADQK